MRIALALVPLMLLAGCGGSDGDNAAAPVAAASPVAAIAPPAGQQWVDVVEKTPEGGYRMGNPNAPVKLVEYGSRTCPVCGAFGREGMPPLERDYVSTGKVSYEFREFMVHGAPDLPASLLGRCGGPGPFFGILEQMYQKQGDVLQKLESITPDFQARLANQPPAAIATAWADRLGYVDFVKERGIPEAKARACLADKAEIDALVKMMNDAQQNENVNGTPTFFINGKIVPDTVSWEQLVSALRKAGA